MILPRPSFLSRDRAWHELVLFGSVYLAYELLRGRADSAAAAALSNAQRVVELQGAAGEQVERCVHLLVAQAPVLLQALSLVYLLAQGVVLPLALVASWRLDRGGYRIMRNAVIVCWAVALPVYRLFPTAPPRLAGPGVLDAVSNATPVNLDSPLALSFYNPYAAVPSLHVALALVIGICAWRASRRRAVRVVAVLWPALVALSVIATGNHYTFDVVAGAGLGAAALAAAVYGGSRRRVVPLGQPAPARGHGPPAD